MWISNTIEQRPEGIYIDLAPRNGVGFSLQLLITPEHVEELRKIIAKPKRNRRKVT